MNIPPIIEKLEDFFSSPEFTGPIGDYLTESARKFEVFDLEAEQPLEYHAAFDGYRKLVERSVEEFLTKEAGTSNEGLVELLQKCQADGLGGALTCLDYLLASTEYSSFLYLISDFKGLDQWGGDDETGYGQLLGGLEDGDNDNDDGEGALEGGCGVSSSLAACSLGASASPLSSASASASSFAEPKPLPGSSSTSSSSLRGFGRSSSKASDDDDHDDAEEGVRGVRSAASSSRAPGNSSSSRASSGQQAKGEDCRFSGAQEYWDDGDNGSDGTVGGLGSDRRQRRQEARSSSSSSSGDGMGSGEAKGSDGRSRSSGTEAKGSEHGVAGCAKDEK